MYLFNRYSVEPSFSIGLPADFVARALPTLFLKKPLLPPESLPVDSVFFRGDFARDELSLAVSSELVRLPAEALFTEVPFGEVLFAEGCRLPVVLRLGIRIF